MDTHPLSTVQVAGWQVSYLDATASTNAVARADAETVGPGYVVVTDHQTAGRGRLDRTWETPAGVALTCSALVDPARPVAAWSWLPLLVGVAVVDAVRATTGVEAVLKWPNDVLVGDRKLAGILVEHAPAGGRALAVLGVGLNVHQQQLPVPTATSLALEGVDVDRGDLLDRLLRGYDAELAAWAGSGGPERLAAAYRERCSTLGREVTAHLPGEQSATGVAEDVDDQGRLVLRTPTGPVAVGAGDVVHLRPAKR